MKTIANHELLGFNDMTYGGGMHGGGHHAPGEEDEEAHLGKKVRHNKVEQNRREMTRKYISELQEMLPNMEDAEPGAGINVVLEGALDYLRSSNGGGGTLEKRRSQAHAGICGSAAAANAGGCRDDEASACQVMAGRACGQINMSSLRFASAFDSAPFGMAVARVDGRILKCNSMFERFLNFLPGALMKETMFSLTAPADLPYTMQVVGGLLTGSVMPANFNKQCVRGDGCTINVNVQISCVWSEGKPKYFVCYVRRREGIENAMPAIPASARVHMLNSSGSETLSHESRSPFGGGGDSNDSGSQSPISHNESDVKMEQGGYPSFETLGFESTLV